MTEFARRLREHLDAPEHRTRIRVPEWAGVLPPDSHGEAAVYAPPFTLSIRAELEEARLLSEEDYAAEIVLRMVEDEEGRRLFDRGDKAVLLASVSADTMMDMADSICGAGPGAPELGEADDGD